MMNNRFIPLLFAGDINVYSVARAFHEQYGIRSAVYGKAQSGPCAGSKIIDYTCNPQADRQETFLRLTLEFAEKHRDHTVLLIGCGDNYVRLISENKARYPKNVIAPCIDAELMDRLIHKEQFYMLCEKNGVDYPDTFVHRKEMEDAFQLPFDRPYIIKPANGILYWNHPFSEQKKVFKAENREELLKILDLIYASGYDDSVIIQNFIPGDDTYMRVLTNYSDRRGQVKMMCLGHVLLEEHTPHGIGNHAVIITEHNETVENQLKKLLEDLNYIGFSNFDIKYDRRDGKYKVFEINTRQGRSNYYVTGAGENIARWLVDDWILDRPLDLKIVTEQSLWMVVPKKVAFDYIRPQQYRNEMKRLIAEGRWANPLLYGPDSAPARRLRLQKSLMSHHLKFKKYYETDAP